MPTVKCLTCSKIFYAKPAEIKKGRGKYCSKKCYYDSMRNKTRPNRWTARIFVKCKECGKSFHTYQNRIDDSRGQFCSKKCFDINRITTISKECEVCKKSFTAKPSDLKKGGGRYCSKKCFAISRTGKDRKKGKRRYISGGYVFIKKANHPNSFKDGYISEHRFIYEKFLGRYLTATEVIHHINKNKSDNRLENLGYFENQALHMKYHRRLQKLSK